VPACSVSSVVMICGGHERAERVLCGGAGSGSRACAVQPVRGVLVPVAASGAGCRHVRASVRAGLYLHVL